MAWLAYLPFRGLRWGSRGGPGSTWPCRPPASCCWRRHPRSIGGSTCRWAHSPWCGSSCSRPRRSSRDVTRIDLAPEGVTD